MNIASSDRVHEVSEILRSCKVSDLTTSFWGKRILRAAKKDSPEFSKVDYEKAANWTVCACGQLSPNIERNKDSVPKDVTLSNYGEEFYQLVKSDNIRGAASKLVAIEERADAYLLEQATS